MDALIEARSISLRIGTKTLLDTLTLALAPGERVALVGPNGAGKSTLLRVLSGELRPRPGAVQLKGKPLAAYRPGELARHRAVLSQSTSVAFPFTVAEVVRMGAGDGGGKRVDDLVEVALAQVDLGALRDRVIPRCRAASSSAHFARLLVQLSRGEAVHGPRLLLLDEPTASLDLRHQLDVLAATRACTARGVAAVAVLHDLNLAAMFAERVVVLDQGRIVADGTPQETINDAVLGRVFKVSAAVNRPAGCRRSVRSTADNRNRVGRIRHARLRFLCATKPLKHNRI